MEDLSRSTEPSPTEPELLAALAGVIDPELGIDIVALGLVVDVYIKGGQVSIALTTTSPGCPLAEDILRDAEARLWEVRGVQDLELDLVFEPAWTPARMSASARLALGWADAPP